MVIDLNFLDPEFHVCCVCLDLSIRFSVADFLSATGLDGSTIKTIKTVKLQHG